MDVDLEEPSPERPCFQELLELQRSRLLKSLEQAVEEHFSQLSEHLGCPGKKFTPHLSSQALLITEKLGSVASCHSFASGQNKRLFTARHHSEVRTFATPPVVDERTRLQRLVQSDGFEWACAVLILSNAAFYGLEVQWQQNSFQVVAAAYVGLFTMELLLRAAAAGLNICSSRQMLWNAFDAFVVAASLAELVVPDVPNLSFLRIVRLTRMVRLFRMVQYLRVFTGLRILVSSVLNTMRSLAWTMFLLASILYVFALLFTQTAMDYARDAERLPEVEEALQRHFGSLLLAVATLFKCITGGIDWDEAARPLGAVHPLWAAVFGAFISFTCLAVLNVVTGVFCQSAIESANRDKDGIVQNQLRMTEKHTSVLKSLFRQLDENNTGLVTLTMFEEFLKDHQIKAYFDGLNMSCDDAWHLFKLLDSDESNSVDIEEFVTGCLKLQGSARSIDTHMLLYESRWALKRLHEISTSLQQLCSFARAERTSLQTQDCLTTVGFSPSEESLRGTMSL